MLECMIGLQVGDEAARKLFLTLISYASNFHCRLLFSGVEDMYTTPPH